MKIAVLLFGHLRNFEKCADSLREHILSKYDCDVFMHTWDEIDSKTFSWHNQRVEPEEITEYISSLITRKYSPLKLEIEHQEKWAEEKILTSKLWPGFQYSTAVMHFMFYSMNRANQLRNQYALENKVDYDYVLVTRPDVTFKSVLDIEKAILQASVLGLNISQCRFFAPMRTNSEWPNATIINGPNDLIFFAKPEVIDRYIESNIDIPVEYAQTHDFNIVSVYTSREIANGIMPIPLSYPLGEDWTYSGRRIKKKGIKRLAGKIIVLLLRPIFRQYKKRPWINYYDEANLK